MAKKKRTPGKSKSRKAAEIIDPRLAKALANSLRVEILAVLSHRHISPVQFTREYGGRLSKVSYHFKVLEGYGCIELADKVQRRGAVEHVYRSAKKPLLGDTDWSRLPKSIQSGVSGAILQTLVVRASSALEEGTFDARDDRHFTWSPMVLDQQGWNEMMALLKWALAKANEIEEQSGGRIAESGEQPIPVTVAFAGFESPPEDR